VSVSIGSSKSTSKQTVHIETVNTSNINAGGKVKITATEGDATLTGVKLNAQEVAIKAARDIELRAAQNKQQIDSKTNPGR
jgi:filamentous hemagglutinin